MKQLEQINITNLIYNIVGKKVMFEREIQAAKCNGYCNYKIIMRYDIGEPISVFDDCVSCIKIRSELKI